MYGDHPFGNPDGARADLSEIKNMFVLETPYAVDFSIHPEALLSKRVVVGAKGSGKTVYLRKMCAMLKNKENSGTGIYVDDNIEQDLNCTESLDICFCFFLLVYQKTLASSFYSNLRQSHGRFFTKICA